MKQHVEAIKSQIAGIAIEKHVRRNGPDNHGDILWMILCGMTSSSACIRRGFEGVWGFLILTFVGFPILYVLPGDDYGGCQENLEDTLVTSIVSFVVSCYS